MITRSVCATSDVNTCKVCDLKAQSDILLFYGILTHLCIQRTSSIPASGLNFFSCLYGLVPHQNELLCNFSKYQIFGFSTILL